MPLFKISVTRSFRGSGIVVEPGMSVQLSSPNTMSPINMDGGRLVNDAFMRVFGIDLKKAGILNIAYLRANRIG
ncbi:MAG: hypothetical protein K2I31_00170 [Duncaniella sp.]|nr:hypothetical protein [Duncaniella sp.]